MSRAFFRVGLLLWLALFTGGFMQFVGCSCRTDEQAELEKKKKEEEEKKKKKKKPEKPKPPYDFRDVRTTPSDQVSGVARNAVKPGHWVTTTTITVANEIDTKGELHAAVVDEDGKPLDVDRTHFFLRSHRPAGLPKGQPRPLESMVYVPRRFLNIDPFQEQANLRRTQLEWRLQSGGMHLLDKRDPVTVMDDFQCYLIVLSSNPSSYSYLLTLDSVAPPYASSTYETNGELLPYYRIVAPRPDRTVPLPEAALTWTSISVLLWDDVDPASLSANQQQAMLDWLHWGGQLIVSGPRTLDRLRGSFLAPFLPATAGDAQPLENSHFAVWNEHWANVPKDAAKQGKGMWEMSVLPDKPMLGVQLKLAAHGQYVPKCGELVAEGWVGRGRIAVTAFPMNDARLLTWRNFDHFVNGALLRRPARTYQATEFNELQLTWKDTPDWYRDPRYVSTMRYFSRDAGVSNTLLGRIRSQSSMEATRGGMRKLPPITISLDKQGDEWHIGGFSGDLESGVAGWNDFSATAEAARQILKDAAKVKIPKADFVLKMVGVYLLVLVPLNWFVFRMLGRVEWAWIAAPIIAIGGAGMVIRMAQLDIGFVRSRTDISIIELQANYDRAHVTRYTALYTSLATDYDLIFEDPHALCLPLAMNPDYKRIEARESAKQVSFQREEKATMRGFQVQSSSTAWTHSEQMLPLGGLEWSGDEATGWKLKNKMPWTLRDIGVVRRSPSGELQAAWIGDLATAAAVTVRFGPFDGVRGVPEWKNSPVMSTSDQELKANSDQPAETDSSNEIRLWRLVNIAVSKLPLAKGDVRLVGWLEEPLPGLTIVPASPQFTSRSLLLAHLQRAPLPPPGRDTNTRLDMLSKEEIDKLLEDTKPLRDLGKDDEPPPRPMLPETPDPSDSPDSLGPADKEATTDKAPPTKDSP